jgi:hypothetical protein
MSRIAKNISSALLFVLFVALALGTSAPELPKIGEFPHTLSVAEDRAYLLHTATHPPESKRDKLLMLSTINAAAIIEPLHRLPLAEDMHITGAITAETESVLAFLVATSARRRTVTILLSDTGGPEIAEEESILFSEFEGLSFVNVDEGRKWVYFQQGYADKPLWEIANGIAQRIAENVVWAACHGEVCQQLRYEDSWLKLYTLSITQATQPTLEAKIAVRQASYFSESSTGGTTKLMYGTRAYALSVTQPILIDVEDYTRPPSLPGRSHEFYGEFANGKVIKVKAAPGQSRDWFCNADCREKYDVYETWVHIYNPGGTEQSDIRLHDY